MKKYDNTASANSDLAEDKERKASKTADPLLLLFLPPNIVQQVNSSETKSGRSLLENHCAIRTTMFDVANSESSLTASTEPATSLSSSRADTYAATLVSTAFSSSQLSTATL
jgi:hypothetical protein